MIRNGIIYYYCSHIKERSGKDSIIVNSIKSPNGIPAPNDQVGSDGSFSDSLKRAQGKHTQATHNGSAAKAVVHAGQIVYDLAAGTYGEHDIASGKLEGDVASVTGEKIDTENMPENMKRMHVASTFIKFLKDSDT